VGGFKKWRAWMEYKCEILNWYLLDTFVMAWRKAWRFFLRISRFPQQLDRVLQVTNESPQQLPGSIGLVSVVDQWVWCLSESLWYKMTDNWIWAKGNDSLKRVWCMRPENDPPFLSPTKITSPSNHWPSVQFPCQSWCANHTQVFMERKWLNSTNQPTNQPAQLLAVF
jgi:hypothetical protein